MEERFKAIANVKSAKVSCGPVIVTETFSDGKKPIKYVDTKQPPVSNGYGFVCFQTPEDAQKALSTGIEGFTLESYKPKERNDVTKIYNNIYVKNFNPAWDERKLVELFSKYGDIKSIAVMEKNDKDGNKRAFAFVCFDR